MASGAPLLSHAEKNVSSFDDVCVTSTINATRISEVTPATCFEIVVSAGCDPFEFTTKVGFQSAVPHLICRRACFADDNSLIRPVNAVSLTRVVVTASWLVVARRHPRQSLRSLALPLPEQDAQTFVMRPTVAAF